VLQYIFIKILNKCTDMWSIHQGLDMDPLLPWFFSQAPASTVLAKPKKGYHGSSSM